MQGKGVLSVKISKLRRNKRVFIIPLFQSKSEKNFVKSSQRQYASWRDLSDNKFIMDTKIFRSLIKQPIFSSVRSEII